MKNTIVIISDHNFEKRPRVLTELQALKNSYEIVLLGEKSGLTYKFYKLTYPLKIPRINFHFGLPLIIKKPISLLVKAYVGVLKIIASSEQKRAKLKNSELLTSLNPQLVILHDILNSDWVVPVCKNLEIPLIVNLHEYYPLEFEDNIYWLKDIKPLYESLIKEYIIKADAYFVVCAEIMKKYANIYSLKNQIIIRNTKPYHDILPSKNEGSEIFLIHHGLVNRSRKLELTIEAMKFLPDNYRLDLMLIPDDDYFLELKRMAERDKRIRFIPPVPTESIIQFINKYDIGLFLLPPLNFNYMNALPNKLFEFIQARLTVVVSPNPEMKKIVEENKIGRVSKTYSPQEFAATILSISREEIQSFKENAALAALSLNDEEEQKKILNTVNTFLTVQ